MRRVRDEAAAADAARRADEQDVAVLRLDVRPRTAADALEERVDVVLQRLARVERPVAVGRLEAVGPLRAPVDEIDGWLLLDADRSGAGVAAVPDEIVGRRRHDAVRIRLSARPEEVLRVRRGRGGGDEEHGGQGESSLECAQCGPPWVTDPKEARLVYRS